MSDVVLVGLITGTFTLLANWSGQICLHWATQEREKTLKRHNFTMRQLEELYSPLIAMVDEFEGIDEVNHELELLSEEKRVSDQDRTTMNAYNQERIRTRFEPLLRKMKELFQAKHFLAESSTLAHYKNFLKGVEKSEQLLQGAIPAGMIKENIQNRKEFFDDIRNNADQKRIELQGKDGFFRGHGVNKLAKKEIGDVVKENEQNTRRLLPPGQS